MSMIKVHQIESNLADGQMTPVVSAREAPENRAQLGSDLLIDEARDQTCGFVESCLPFSIAHFVLRTLRCRISNHKF